MPSRPPAIVAAPTLREGDLLTAPQALQILPIGRTLLYELAASRELPAVRVGAPGSRRARVLFLRSGIEEYVHRQRVRQWTPTAPTPVDADGIRARVLRGGRKSS